MEADYNPESQRETIVVLIGEKYKRRRPMTMSKETIEKLIERTGVSIISSVDELVFPNTKAMLPPRKRQ